MTLTDALGQCAGGLRLALAVLAAMSLMARLRDQPPTDAAERLKRRAWLLIALAAVSYSPAHAAWLLGRPAPRLLASALDTAATGAACWAFVDVLAARGLKRGLSSARVTRGRLVNAAVVVATVGTAWVIR